MTGWICLISGIMYLGIGIGSALFAIDKGEDIFTVDLVVFFWPIAAIAMSVNFLLKRLSSCGKKK